MSRFRTSADDRECHDEIRDLDVKPHFRRIGFFDVLTAFQPNEDGPQAAQWKQGCAIAWAVYQYIKSDKADPAGYADNIAVLPCRDDDFVSRALKQGSCR